MIAAISGTGFMGKTHAEALFRTSGTTLKGIQGSSPEKSGQAARALGLPTAYGTYQELIADPEVNVVHLTTPNRLHYDQAVAALEAGKHVLCEKPLAMTSEESRALVELARSKSLAAGVNYNIRFYPLCREARSRVQAGDLGEVFSVSGSYVQDWLLYDTDYNWRILAEEQGELRALADIGTHWIDLVKDITGLRPIELLADLATVHPIRQRPSGEIETYAGSGAEPRVCEPIPVTTDDLGSVLFRFEGGARGCVFVSQAVAGRKNRLSFEIAGSRSALHWDSEEPNRLWCGHRDKPNELLTKDPALLSEPARPHAGYPGGHAEGYPDTFKMGFHAFYDYIARGDFTAPAEFATFEDGHDEIVLCESILESHREQRWVTIPQG